MSNIAALVTMEAKDAAEHVPEGSDLATRFEAACKSAKNHWMAPNEDDAFLGAVGGLYETADEDEKARILAECEAIKNMNALLSGVPVDMERVELPDDPIGLVRIWRDCSA